jgi:hypothetical protein
MSGQFKYGVSLYSYTEDFGNIMTLEDGFDHAADTGATGSRSWVRRMWSAIPNPAKEWLDTWFGLLDRYQLEPTNMCSWVDTKLRLGRQLTVEEGAGELERDLRLAHRRLQVPASQVRRDRRAAHPDPIWSGAVERVLDLANKFDIVMPEIHSPTPIRHPAVEGYIDFIERTGTPTSAC